MSDGVLAGLPRFDSGIGHAATRGPNSWLRELGGSVVGDTLQGHPQAADVRVERVREEAAHADAPPQPLDLKKIEASLASLNARLDKIERDAQVQTLQTIQSIASKLFPELSKQFLAEEIGRHLPALVPASAAVVEIQAEAGLAGKLRELVERSPALAHRCTVTELPTEGQGRVDVSWQSGGLSFDFDGLLRACLSHLTSTQTITKE